MVRRAFSNRPASDFENVDSVPTPRFPSSSSVDPSLSIQVENPGSGSSRRARVPCGIVRLARSKDGDRLILTAARSDPSAAVQSWGDIDRLDVQPGKGIVKVQCKNRWELQLDLQTAEILSSKYRRSDFIESLHDGSFFHELAKLYVFLPNGLILLGLWLTGAYLWWMPFGARRRKQRRTADVA